MWAFRVLQNASITKICRSGSKMCDDVTFFEGLVILADESFSFGATCLKFLLWRYNVMFVQHSLIYVGGVMVVGVLNESLFTISKIAQQTFASLLTLNITETHYHLLSKPPENIANNTNIFNIKQKAYMIICLII